MLTRYQATFGSYCLGVLLLAGCGAPLNTNSDGLDSDPLSDEEHVTLSQLGSELSSKASHQRSCRTPDAYELELLHTHWWLEGFTLPTDRYGNTVVDNVVFLALPDAPGDGTPGSVDLTLSNKQWFFLPLFGLFGTSYSDGTPPDPFEPLSIFETLDITFAIDGVPLVTTDNVLDYFFQFELEPPIPIDAPPFEAVIWGEEVSVLHEPLSRGKHTLTLDVLNTEPAFGGFLEWHNTWNITVVRGKHR